MDDKSGMQLGGSTFASFENESAVMKSEGRWIVTPRALAFSMIPGTSFAPSSSKREDPISIPSNTFGFSGSCSCSFWMDLDLDLDLDCARSRELRAMVHNGT